MTDATAVRPVRSVASKRWDVLRWILLLGWIAVAVTIPLTSARTSSWDELKDGVEAGDVTQVRMSRELQAGSDGEVTVYLRWQEGGWARVTRVTQASDDEQAEYADDDRSTAMLTSSPTAELRALQPGLVVSGLAAPDIDVGPFLEVEEVRFLGFELTQGLTLGAGLLAVLGVVVLIFGPAPWRATKWAWFWLMSVTPFAVLFVLLSGPVPGLPPPRRPMRRLTGGWAFLVAVVLGAFVSVG